MKFTIIVDDLQVAKLPPGVLEQMLHKEMMAQLERVLLYGTSVEKAMLGTIGDIIVSSDSKRPPRRKGPPSRDARKDRWCK